MWNPGGGAVKCAGTMQLSNHKHGGDVRCSLVCAGGVSATPSLSLLQVSVNLKAVVAGVGNSHMSVRGEGEALGAV